MLMRSRFGEVLLPLRGIQNSKFKIQKFFNTKVSSFLNGCCIYAHDHYAAREADLFEIALLTLPIPMLKSWTRLKILYSQQMNVSTSA